MLAIASIRRKRREGAVTPFQKQKSDVHAASPGALGTVTNAPLSLAATVYAVGGSNVFGRMLRRANADKRSYCLRRIFRILGLTVVATIRMRSRLSPSEIEQIKLLYDTSGGVSSVSQLVLLMQQTGVHGTEDVCKGALEELGYRDGPLMTLALFRRAFEHCKRDLIRICRTKDDTLEAFRALALGDETVDVERMANAVEEFGLTVDINSITSKPLALGRNTIAQARSVSMNESRVVTFDSFANFFSAPKRAAEMSEDPDDWFGSMEHELLHQHEESQPDNGPYDEPAALDGTLSGTLWQTASLLTSAEFNGMGGETTHRHETAPIETVMATSGTFVMSGRVSPATCSMTKFPDAAAGEVVPTATADATSQRACVSPLTGSTNSADTSEPRPEVKASNSEAVSSQPSKPAEAASVPIDKQSTDVVVGKGGFARTRPLSAESAGSRHDDDATKVDRYKSTADSWVAFLNRNESSILQRRHREVLRQRNTRATGKSFYVGKLLDEVDCNQVSLSPSNTHSFWRELKIERDALRHLVETPSYEVQKETIASPVRREFRVRPHSAASRLRVSRTISPPSCDTPVGGAAAKIPQQSTNSTMERWLTGGRPASASIRDLRGLCRRK